MDRSISKFFKTPLPVSSHLPSSVIDMSHPPPSINQSAQVCRDGIRVFRQAAMVVQNQQRGPVSPLLVLVAQRLAAASGEKTSPEAKQKPHQFEKFPQ